MSYAPPPFAPPAPQKKGTNVVLIVLGIIAFLFLTCVGGIFAVGFWAKGAVFDKTLKPMVGCYQNFEAIRTGLLNYAKEHDGKLPPAETWQDEATPFVVRALKAQKHQFGGTMDPNGLWQCDPIGGDNKTPTGIAFNSDLASKKVDDVKDPYDTILIYEIPSPKQNASGEFVRQPKNGPKIFGEPREWFALPIKGDDRSFRRSGNKNSFTFDTNDDNSSSSDKSTDSENTSSDSSVKSDSTSKDTKTDKTDKTEKTDKGKTGTTDDSDRSSDND